MNIIDFIFKQDTEHKTLLNVPIKAIMSNKKECHPKNKSKRLNQETGVYNNKPTDVNYFNAYYHEKRRRYLPCKQCCEQVLLSSMPTHIISKKCLKKMALFLNSD